MNGVAKRPTVLILGTLDTKGEEFAYLRDRLIDAGCDTIIADLGILGTPSFTADITREEVLNRAGVDLESLRSGERRGDAIDAVIRGGIAVARELYRRNAIDGVIAMGGGSGTTVGCAIMDCLPFGMPKVVVTTLSRLQPHINGTDIVVIRTLVDLVGLNPITAVHIGQGAGAIAGMVKLPIKVEDMRKSVVITCLGVTTPGVVALRDRLRERGKESIILHRRTSAVGMLIDAGLVEAIVDFTPNELTDSVVVEGTDAADRLGSARAAGIPIVAVPGALDMILVFAPADDRPEALRDRPYVVHSPAATLIRTTVGEQGRMGEVLGYQLAASAGPVAAVIPTRGFSMWDAPGRAFAQPDARAAFVDGLSRAGISDRITTVDAHINDDAFAIAVAESLLQLTDEGRTK